MRAKQTEIGLGCVTIITRKHQMVRLFHQCLGHSGYGVTIYVGLRKFLSRAF